MRVRRLMILVAVVCIEGISNASSPHYKFSPAGNFPGAIYSVPLGLSLTQIVGYYSVPNHNLGYIQTGTSFVSVDPGGSKQSNVAGINNLGVAVGGYCPAGCAVQSGAHGYVYEKGKITNIDYPAPNTSTTAFGINDLGQIVGGYCPNYTQCPIGDGYFAFFGFLYSGGVFTTIAFPGAQSSQAEDINNAGQIVGLYTINDTGPHSYLYANGVYTNIDYPGSGYTVASSINNLGVVGGLFAGPNGLQGFTYSNGKFTSITAPGGTGTGMTAINDRGDIVGLRYVTTGFDNFKGIPQGSAPGQ